MGAVVPNGMAHLICTSIHVCCTVIVSIQWVSYNRSMANSQTEARRFRTPYSKVPCSGNISVPQPDQMDCVIGCGVTTWLQNCCVQHTAM